MQEWPCLTGPRDNLSHFMRQRQWLLACVKCWAYRDWYDRDQQSLLRIKLMRSIIARSGEVRDWGETDYRLQYGVLPVLIKMTLWTYIRQHLKKASGVRRRPQFIGTGPTSSRLGRPADTVGVRL